MKDFFRHNGGLVLLVAILLAVATALGSVLLGGSSNPVSNAWGVITSPIRGGVNSFLTWVEDRYDYAFRYEELKEENQRLKEVNAQLQKDAREGQAAAQENERLRDLLGLAQKRSDFQMESANVSSYGSSNWESTLTLSKGTNCGIEVGDCVITSTGALVGVVSEVGYNFCSVATVVDAGLEMGGLISRTSAAGILEGDFSLMEENRLKLSYLPEDTDFIAGDEVVTSGMGGTYPSGLLVGYVEEVRNDPSGMTRYAVIAPAAELNKLIEVFVIKDFDVIE